MEVVACAAPCRVWQPRHPLWAELWAWLLPAAGGQQAAILRWYSGAVADRLVSAMGGGLGAMHGLWAVEWGCGVEAGGCGLWDMHGLLAVGCGLWSGAGVVL